MRHRRRSSTPRSDKESRHSLQVKIVLANQRQNLADLIGLGLAAKLLQREDLFDAGMHLDAMTASPADFLEFQRLEQPDQVIEVHVPDCAGGDPAK